MSCLVVVTFKPRASCRLEHGDETTYYNDDGVSVFVEDVVLVTEDGVDVLAAALPRQSEELERMVGTAGE